MESSPLKLQRILSQTSHLQTSLMASWITWTPFLGRIWWSWWTIVTFTSWILSERWSMNSEFHGNFSYLRELKYCSGMRCEFLPPYLPDFNPIELTFSAVKAHLKRNHHHLLAAMGPGCNLDVYVALHEAVYSITPVDAAGWFHHCSYI